MENSAGYWKDKKPEECDLLNEEKNAPMVGPKINPKEKATPIKACNITRQR